LITRFSYWSKFTEKRLENLFPSLNIVKEEIPINFLTLVQENVFT